jgi:hypothetical protein
LSLPALLGIAVVGLLLSIVPFYGYFAHGGRDQQWYFLVMLGCWLASGAIGLGMIVLAFVGPGKHRPRQLLSLGVGVVLLVVTGFAWGGVVEGFFELVAG